MCQRCCLRTNKCAIHVRQLAAAAAARLSGWQGWTEEHEGWFGKDRHHIFFSCASAVLSQTSKRDDILGESFHQFSFLLRFHAFITRNTVVLNLLNISNQIKVGNFLEIPLPCVHFRSPRMGSCNVN